MQAMAIEDLLHPLLGKYMGSPAWLRSSAGRVYSWLPPRVRYGNAYRRFHAEASLRDPQLLAELAERKLAETLRWALLTVPAYQGFADLLCAGLDPRQMLAALPVTDKLDMKHHPERYLSGAAPASARLEMFTGGSTRNPMRFFLEKHVTRSREFAFMREFRRRACLPGDALTLALRGRTVPSAARPGGRLWMVEPIKRQLILSSDHLSPKYMGAYAAALLAHQPRYVEAFPSALYPLAKWLAEHPLPEFTRRVKGVMLFSENVYDYQLAKFREVFQCPILAHYGHSERVLMAATMPDDERYFFWPQYGHLELLDAQDRPVTRPGQLGFIVGTGFDNRVMPFVRYRTGDLAVLSDREHPQLPGFPVVERIAGRLQEFVVCRDGRLISITTLGVAHFPQLARVDAIQYEQQVPGRLVLKVVAPAPLTAAERESIAAAVARKTQHGCQVEVVAVESIARTPRGKARMLVQHLDLRRFLGAFAEAV